MIMHTVVDTEMAASLLGVTQGTVRVIAHRDKWRRNRIGRRTVYYLDDVDATLQKRTDTPTTPYGM